MLQKSNFMGLQKTVDADPSAILDDEPMRPLADHKPLPPPLPRVSTIIRAAEHLPQPAAATTATLSKPTSHTSTTSDAAGADAVDPNASLRWKLLVMLCLFLFGTDYCFDMPGSIGAGEGNTIQTLFYANGKTYNQKMNQSLYAIYSYPNMVMTIAGGLLIDKYLGLRKTALLMAGTVVVSSVIFSFGVALTNFPLIVLGRFLFGCSGETLFVAQSAYLSRWFGSSPYMSLVFGIAVSCSRLGGGASYMLSPPIARHGGVVMASFVGSVFAALSFICCGVVGVIDARCEANGTVGMSAAKKHRQQQKRQKEIKKAASLRSSPASPAGAVMQFPKVDVRSGGSKTLFSIGTPGATAEGIIMSESVLPMAQHNANTANSVVPSPPPQHNTAADAFEWLPSSPTTDNEGKASDVSFQIRFIPTLPKTLWFLALCGMLCYGATFPFVGIAKTFFERVYAMESANASFVAGLFHIFGAFMCPIMGAVVDKIGKSPRWLVIATSGLLVVFANFLLLPGFLPPTVVIATMSFFYSVFVASLWSYAPLTVPVAAGGFGFGVLSAAVNFGLATSPLFTGSILDAFTFTASLSSQPPQPTLADGAASSSSPVDALDILPTEEGFYYAILFLMGVIGCALLASITLWNVDSGNLCGDNFKGEAVATQRAADRGESGAAVASSSPSSSPAPVVGILMAEPSKRAALKKARDDRLEELWRHLVETKMMEDIAKEQR